MWTIALSMTKTVLTGKNRHRVIYYDIEFDTVEDMAKEIGQAIYITNDYSAFGYQTGNTIFYPYGLTINDIAKLTEMVSPTI